MSKFDYKGLDIVAAVNMLYAIESYGNGNDELNKAVVSHLAEMSHITMQTLASRYLYNYCFTDAMIESNRAIFETKRFIKWLEDKTGVVF